MTLTLSLDVLMLKDFLMLFMRHSLHLLTLTASTTISSWTNNARYRQSVTIIGTELAQFHSLNQLMWVLSTMKKTALHDIIETTV